MKIKIRDASLIPSALSSLFVVVGSIVSYLEEEILWLFGDSWEELVVLNMIILFVITALIILFENIALNNRINLK